MTEAEQAKSDIILALTRIDPHICLTRAITFSVDESYVNVSVEPPIIAVDLASRPYTV